LAAGLEAVDRKMQEQNLEIRHLETGGTAAGHEAFLVVDAEAAALKELAAAIERDHPLGRLFDIDVFDEHYGQLSRESCGGAKRACLICGGQAALCRRSGRHTTEDVLRRLEKIVSAYFLIADGTE
jgi:holo-ACP synthase